MASAITLFVAARPQFLPVVLLPLVAAIGLAARHGSEPQTWMVVLLLIGGICVQSGANLLNDYYDHLSGVDDNNPDPVPPFAGGSRFIQERRLRPRDIWWTAWGCLAIAVAIAWILAAVTTWLMLPLLAVGLLSAVAYSAPPLKLDYRGLGLPVIMLDFGILPVLCAYRIAGDRWSWDAVLPAAVVGLLAANILFAAEFPDRQADAAGGKRTVVVRWGPATCALLHLGFALAALGLLGIAVHLDQLPPLALLGLLAAIPAALAFRTLRRRREPRGYVPGVQMAILTHLAVTAAITLAVWS
ncbi:MAG: prenyltransferase [Planctomycetota bacterium]